MVLRQSLREKQEVDKSVTGNDAKGVESDASSTTSNELSSSPKKQRKSDVSTDVNIDGKNMVLRRSLRGKKEVDKSVNEFESKGSNVHNSESSAGSDESDVSIDKLKKALFDKKNDSDSDDQPIVTDVIKNPLDEGEGENIVHCEDLVGIPNTVKHKEIKLKEEEEDLNTSQPYLRRFNGRTSGIPEDVLSTIEQYGNIQNVKGDGNCGFYSMMNGLSHVGIQFENDINVLRKNIYDFIDKNRDELHFSNELTTRRKRNAFIDKEIINQCWSPNVDFSKKCDYKYWLEANSLFPIMAKYYQCNVIWYDVHDDVTKAAICKEKFGRQLEVTLERKSFVPPKSLCVNSIWKLRVTCIYYHKHFMCLNEYLKLE